MDNERIREQHLRDASETMALEAARILAIDALMNDSDSWEKWDAEHKGESSGSSGSSKGGSRVDKSSTYNVPTINGMRVKGKDGITYYDPGIAYKGTIISWNGGTKMRAIGLDDVKGAIDKLPGNTSSLVKMVYLMPGASKSETDYVTSLGLDPNEYLIQMTADSRFGYINIWNCDDTTGRGEIVLEDIDSTLQHEVGHLLDKDKFASSSKVYESAVKADANNMVDYTNDIYVSEYAKQYAYAHPEAPYTEDFAEAFKAYCAYKESGKVSPPADKAARFSVIEDVMKGVGIV